MFQIGATQTLEIGLGVSFLYLSVNRHYSIRGLARLGLGLSI
jgi:hypothetical protein